MVRRGFFLALLVVTAVAVNVQTSGIPIFGKADAIAATRSFATAWEIREFIKTIPNVTPIPGPIPDQGSGAPRNDQVTANAICRFAGYGSAQILSSSNYSSCGDNTIGYWDANANNFIIYGACNYNNFIMGLTCSNPLPACSNTLDDDGDGKKDLNDPGCSSASDNDETDPAPVTTSVDLKINGQDGTINVTQGQAVTLTWTSMNAARCDTGMSNMPGWTQYTSLPTSGTAQITVTQTGTFGIQCAQTLTSNMIAQDSVAALVTMPQTSNNATCGVSNFPQTVTPGQSFTASFTINNTGTTSWTNPNYNLYDVGPVNGRFGPNGSTLPFAPVSPSQAATFNLNLVAPSTPGTYPFQWRMGQNGVEFFGATCGGTITVQSGGGTCTQNELVQNGTFETPSIVNALTNNLWAVYGGASDPQFYASQPSIQGWIPKTYQVELQKTGLFGNAYQGSQYAEIDDPNGKFEQDIATVPGQSYTLSFAYALRPDAGAQQMGVYWGGSQLAVLGGTPSGSGIQWQVYTYTVTATSTTTRLAFGKIGGAGGAGNFIDAVSLRANCGSTQCNQQQFNAANGSLASQGWTPLTPGANQSVTTMTENGVTFLRISDQSTTQGLRTEYTAITDAMLSDKDWTLEMKARIRNSTENGYNVGMNMLIVSPSGKYVSVYIDTDKFGPLGTSQGQYDYARTVNRNTTDGFHIYTINNHKNGAGVNDDTFDVLFDGQVVMANVTRNEIWNSGVWSQNINGITFGIGSSPGQGEMDVAYVNFNNGTATQCQTQCNDGLDNDGDGATDMNDFSCTNAGDNDETNPKAQCQDGTDNDGDGLADYPSDLGCSSKQDNDESGGASTCTTTETINFDTLAGGIAVNGTQSNGHPFPGTFISTQYATRGAIFSSTNGQPAIATAGMIAEASTQPNFLVGNNNGSSYADSYYGIQMQIANQGASKVDVTLISVGSAGVIVKGYNANGQVVAQVSKTGTGDGAYVRDPISLLATGIVRVTFDRIDQTIPHVDGFGIDDVVLTFPSTSCGSQTQCSDGADNDFDGAIDTNDFSCTNSGDNDETNPKSQCQDGTDNDGDGLTDYPSDPGCTSRQDNDESNSTGTTNCTQTDPRIVCVNTAFAAAMGRSVSVNGFATQPNGTIIAYWKRTTQSDTMSYNAIRSIAGQCGLQLLQPQNFTDASLIAAKQAANTTFMAGVPIEGTCTAAKIEEYRAAGHKIGIDADCNQLELVFENGNPDVATDGVRDTSSNQQVGDRALVCVPTTTATQCNDGIDNDGDGATDLADFSCTNSGDNDETNPKAQCQDGFDNDGDGLIDYPNDPGCVNKQDNDEAGGGSGTAQCSDGIDNDGDGLIDSQDPGCHSDRNRFNTSSYTASGTSEATNDRTKTCQDGIDNNGNSLIDAQDPICHTDNNANNQSSFDPNRSETGSSTSNQCSDGLDNDGDGLIDTFDPDCHTDGIATNSASFSGSRNESSSGNTDCLDINIEDTPDPADPGEEVEYEINVENNCSTDRTFTLKAFLDNDMEFEDADRGGDDISDDEVEWDQITLKKGDDKDFTLTVTLDDDLEDGDEVELEVTAGNSSQIEKTDIGEEDDSNDDNGSNGIGFSVTTQSDRSDARPNDTVSYTITVRNNTSSAIDNATLENLFTSGQLSILDGAGAVVDGTVMRWNLGRLEANVSRQLRFTTRIGSTMKNGDVIANTARLTADGKTTSASGIVRIVTQMPQTGISRLMGGSSRFLSPVTGQNASGSESGLPGLFSWFATITGGLGLGSLAAKKYLI